MPRPGPAEEESDVTAQINASLAQPMTEGEPRLDCDLGGVEQPDAA